ncbi:MAG: dihydroorotate dehydrogenase-like protein [Bacteroidales bacterium]|nr:dihydroorotate dehydrogenase-like protein [Bacteroidales bacterium]
MKKISLKTRFGGLELENPIIVSSSGLTDSVEKITRLENCSAGAIVLKSLFEEQIMLRVAKELPNNEFVHPEEYDFLRNFITNDALQQYLSLIKEAKAVVKIPIIASINCYSEKGWTDFAQNIEKAGADALEINIMSINTDKELKYGKTETLYIDILSDLRKRLKIPVIMKMGRHHDNLIGLLVQLQHNNANGVVLFNRTYSPDIDLKKMIFTHRSVLSCPESFGETLRWTGLASGFVPELELCSSGGINSGDDVIKSLLTGAAAVEICSLIYREGPEIIPVLLSNLIEWMRNSGFESIKQFKGNMNYKADCDENAYLRTQFMKYFSQYNK